MKKKVILLGLFIVAVQWIQAQKQLTLEECRQLAIQNNKELQVARERVKVADYEKKAAFTK